MVVVPVGLVVAGVVGCGGAGRTLDDGSGTGGETGIVPFASSTGTGLDGSGAPVSTGPLDDTAARPTNDDDDGLRFDLGTTPDWPSCPSPSDCPLGPSSVVVEQDITPTGPQPVMYAAFGQEYCGDELLVLLSPTPLDVDGELDYPSDGIRIWLLDSGKPEVYEGVYPTGFLDCTSGYCGYEVGEMEFLEPFEMQSLCEPDVIPRIHARAEIHDAGWDFAVELEATHCRSISDCFCPCE
jgi:hypothetical protein